jgi:hypothetical protein
MRRASGIATLKKLPQGTILYRVIVDGKAVKAYRVIFQRVSVGTGDRQFYLMGNTREWGGFDDVPIGEVRETETGFQIISPYATMIAAEYKFKKSYTEKK